MKAWFGSLVLAMMLSSGVLVRHCSAQTQANAEGVQVITVTAKKYEFNPSSIHVKQGTKVRLNITATDHAHGFKISPLAEGSDKAGEPGLVFSSPQDCTKIEEGKTESVEFTAQKPGTYKFRCCVVCGFHHHSMKGELIVEP
jgi:cytochrome c oxidase subunit 2